MGMYELCKQMDSFTIGSANGDDPVRQHRNSSSSSSSSNSSCVFSNYCQVNASTPVRSGIAGSPEVNKSSPADPLLQRLPPEKLREVIAVNCDATLPADTQLKVRARMRQGWGAGEGTPTSLSLRWEAWLHQVAALQTWLLGFCDLLYGI
jgi:hypothetical protein